MQYPAGASLGADRFPQHPANADLGDDATGSDDAVRSHLVVFSGMVRAHIATMAHHHYATCSACLWYVHINVALSGNACLPGDFVAERYPAALAGIDDWVEVRTACKAVCLGRDRQEGSRNSHRDHGYLNFRGPKEQWRQHCERR